MYKAWLSGLLQRLLSRKWTERLGPTTSLLVVTCFSGSSYIQENEKKEGFPDSQWWRLLASIGFTTDTSKPSASTHVKKSRITKMTISTISPSREWSLPSVNWHSHHWWWNTLLISKIFNFLQLSSTFFRSSLCGRRLRSFLLTL